jgi:clavulanate-9-aldehyde reducatase
MSVSLEGKVAIVTGGSRGIGRAVAAALLQKGAHVAISGINKEHLEQADAELSRVAAAGARVLTFAADVRDHLAVQSLVDETVRRQGGLDILVNNAGVMLLGPVAGADTDEWRRMIDVNLLGLLYATHAALPLIEASGGGDVVNVSSVAGRRADAGAAVYNMTKFGVHAFSEALRQEALHAKIRVTTVAPGFVETELQGHNVNPLVRRTMERSREQIGEVLRAEDIAEQIVHAVSLPPHVCVNEVVVRPTGQAR